MDRPHRTVPTPLIALAGWIVPGLGYFLLGERARGLICAITIIILYLAGILIGGIRVIDVPGYAIDGHQRLSRNGEWRLRTDFAAEVMNKPWYIAQTLVGPLNLAGTWFSLDAAQNKVSQSTARIFDIGTLYTALAGMLNLLVIIDSATRATQPQPEPAAGGAQ